jgi:exopolysaccharide biosynthesis protein
MFTPKLVPLPRRTRSRLGILLTIALLLSYLLIAPSARGAPTGRPHVRVLAPGVALTTYIDRRVPVRAYVLWIDPSQGASLAMALAHNQLGELERTSDMAKDHGALVAVNGDLGSTISGRPVHPFALGGDLVQTSPVLGAMFSMSRDGSMRIGHPTEQSLSITEVDTGETWPIASWNHGGPTSGELTAHTAIGGALEAPRAFTCSARLLPSGPSTSTDVGSTRTYSIDQSGCFSSRLQPGEGVVVSAAPTTDEATFIRSLSAGESVRIDWSLGSAGVTDAIGGSTVLMQDGHIVLGTCTGAICSRNPRTAIGLTADGRIVLVVVDGRQSSSVGMSLAELANFFQRLGVESAMNLDGGGSSAMVIRGRVVNHPSDGFERSVTNALLVHTDG